MTSPEISSAGRSEPPNSFGNEEEAFSQQEPRFFSFFSGRCHTELRRQPWEQPAAEVPPGGWHGRPRDRDTKADCFPQLGTRPHRLFQRK